MGIPVPPFLRPDKGYFHLISVHGALPCNLAVGWAQSYRLKMDAVASLAGRIGYIGEAVFVAGSEVMVAASPAHRMQMLCSRLETSVNVQKARCGVR